MFTLFDPHYAAVGMARPSQIAGRLSAILDDRRDRTISTRRGTLGLTLLVLTALVPLAAVRVGAKLPLAVPGAKSDMRNDSAAETALPSASDAPSLESDMLESPQSAVQPLVESELRPRIAPAGFISSAAMPIPPLTALNAIAWGKVKDGLQAGLRIDTERRRFAVGEGIPLTFFLRNASDHDIAFIYTANPFDDQPLVEDAKGISHRIFDALPTGLPWAISVVLKPGESLIGHKIELVLGENRDRKPTPYPCVDKPAPGLYRISQSYRYRILSVKEVQDLMTRLDKKDDRVYAHPLELFTKEGKPYRGRGALTGAGGLYKRQTPDEGIWSKKVEFEVVAGDAPMREQKAPVIAWGRSSGGLQAGIGFAEKRSRYTIGEILEVNVYVRNAGYRPTTFSWQSAPQFSHSSLILPTLTGPGGKEQVFSGGGPIEKPIRSQTLQPGEMVPVSRTLLALEPMEGGYFGFSMEPMVSIAQGRHRLRQEVNVMQEGQNLTLSSGELEFDAASSVGRASWGAAIGGLQAGLSFVGERRGFAIGETIKMDLYWRNAGNKDLSVCYAEFHDFDHVPNVFNAKGERMALSHNAPRIFPIKRTRILKPGETVRIGSVNCVLASVTKEGREGGEYPTLEALPGKYRISQYTIVQPWEGAPVASKGGKIAASASAPVSGELEFEVEAK